MPQSQMQVSAKLLENYRSVVPVTAGGEIATTYNPAGSLAVVGIGTNGQASVVIEDDASDTGWSLVSLGGSDLSGPTVIVTDKAGLFHVFATSDDGGVWHAWQNSSSAKDWTSLSNVDPTHSICGTLVSGIDSTGTAHVLFVTRAFYVKDTWSDATQPGGWNWTLEEFAPTLPFNNPSQWSVSQPMILANDAQGHLRIQVCCVGQLAPWGPMTYWASFVDAGAPGQWAQPSPPIQSPPYYPGYLIGQGPLVQSLDADGTLTWFGLSNGGECLSVSQGTDDVHQPPLYVPMIVVDVLSGTHWQVGTNYFPTLNPTTKLIELAFMAYPCDENDNITGPGQLAFAVPTNHSFWNWTFRLVQPAPDGSPTTTPVFPSSPSAFGMPPNTMGALRDPKTGNLQVLAIDTQGHLCFAEQDGTQANGWGPIVDLGFPVLEIYPRQHPDGYLEVFAVASAGDDMLVIRRDPTTMQWTCETIDVDIPRAVETYNCYSSEVLVTDANGAPRNGEACTVWASDPVALRINGTTHHVDEQGRVASVVSNSNGLVTIEMSTDALNSPQLYLSAGFMASGESVTIIPQHEVQATLESATTSGAVLLAQTNAKGNPLVPADSPIQGNPNGAADAVARALNNCAQMAGTSGASQPRVSRFLMRNKKRAAVRYNAPGLALPSGRLDLGAVSAQSWILDFSGGSPVYRDLTPEQAEALVAEMSARPRPLRRDKQLGSFFDDVGDFFESIYDGAADLVSVVTQVIVDPVSKLVTEIQEWVQVAIDGVTYAFNTVVDTVEQVFDTIEAIFVRILVTFEQLIEWLAFFFDWNDILLTKRAIAFSVNQGLGVATAASQLLNAQAQEFFTALQGQVQASFQALTDSLGGQSPLGIQSGDQEPSSVSDNISHNIVLSGVLNATTFGSPSVRAAVRLHVPAVRATSEDLLAALTQCGSDFLASPGISTATTFFSGLGNDLQSNPDKAMQTLIPDLLDAVSQLIQSGIQLAANVVNAITAAVTAIIQMVQSALNAEIDIPLVSDLYTYISGDPLTALDLMALISAIPTTLVYKAMTNQAPFSAESLGQFTSTYTATALIQAAGLGGATSEERKALLAALPAPTPGVKTLLGVLGMFAYFGNGAASAWSDVQPLTPLAAPATPLERTASILSLGTQMAAWFLLNPWFFGSTGTPSFSGDSDDAGCALWLYGAIPIIADSGFMYLSWKKSSFNGDIGVALDVLGGLAGLVATGIVAEKQKSEGKYNATTTAANVMVNLPNGFKFLRLDSLGIGRNPWCALALAGVDFVGNVTGGILYLVDATKPSPSLALVGTDLMGIAGHDAARA